MILVAVPVPVPAVFDRIAICETGDKHDHRTRDFISRYGIRRIVWNEYRPSWIRPVPARKQQGERVPSRVEQDAVALAIARRAGLSAWSCWRKSEWVQNG